MDRRGTLSNRAESGETIPSGGAVGVGDGWYSYNLGNWHLISLNIECETQPGGCSTTGSWFAAELEWLKKDLEENHSACTAAYWHQPTFSAADSLTEEGTTAKAFWELLYEYNADLVLNGHDHLYARYRPLDPSGNSDPRRGIREFIVGTGGETLDTVVTTNTTTADPSANPNFNAQNLEAASGNFWGVMALTTRVSMATGGISSRHWSFLELRQGLSATRASDPATAGATGNCLFAFTTLVDFPHPSRNLPEGGDFLHLARSRFSALRLGDYPRFGRDP